MMKNSKRIFGGSGAMGFRGRMGIGGWLCRALVGCVALCAAGWAPQVVAQNASWMGNSVFFINGAAYLGRVGSPSYSGSVGTLGTASSRTALGNITALSLGGYTQTYGDDNGANNPSTLHYAIDNASFVSQTLSWFNFNGSNNEFATGGSKGTEASIDVSGLSAGAHTITIYLSSANDKAYDSANSANYGASFTLIKQVAKPTGASLTYTGNAQTGVLAGTGYTLSSSSATIDGSGNAVATDAGTYSVTATLAENYQWSDGSSDEQTVSFTIARAKTATEPTLTASFTYDGTEKTALTGGTHVTLAEYRKTGAGNYTATATPEANYAWSDGTYATKEYAWSIAKAAATISGVGNIVVNYGAASQSLGGTASSGVAVSYAFKSGDSSVATITGSTIAFNAVGTATFTASAEATANYLAPPPVDFTVTVNAVSAVVTLEANSFTFTGSEIRPAISSVMYGGVAQPASSYTVSYANNVNVGAAAAVTVTDNGGRYAQTVYFSIAAAAMSGVTVAAIPDQVYTGSAIVPTLSVSLGSYALTEGTDYTATFGNNLNVGTATVTLAANSANFSGSKTGTTFAIVKANQATAVGLATTEFTYAGETFPLQGTGGDYGTYSFAYGADGTGAGSVSGSTLTVTRAGTMTIRVTRSGDSNHNARTDTVTVRVNPATVAPPTGQALTYNGATQTGVADGANYSVANGTGKDANASYSATVSLDNAALYTWSDGTTADKSVAWSIAKAALTVTAASKSIVYGAAAPSYTVSYSGFKGSDNAASLATAPTASCAYAQWDDKGSYAITAAGGVSGNYSFTYVPGTLTVAAKNLSGATVALSGETGATWDGEVHSVSLASVTLAGYSGLTYTQGGTTSATAAGSYAVTVTGTGNYTGTASGTWAILAKSLAGATVTLPQSVYGYTGNAIEPVPTVVLDGVTLTSGTDYSVSYSDNTGTAGNTSTATVTITGINNYGGTAGTTFTIVYSFASWIGGSFVVANTGGADVWYNASGSGNPPSFNGVDLGTISSLSLGGQAQTYGDSDGVNNPSAMCYAFDSSEDWHVVPLHHICYDNGNQHNYFGMGEVNGVVSGDGVTSVSLAGLSAGAHTVKVFFRADYQGNGEAYDSNNDANYVAHFTLASSAAPAPVTGFAATADGYELVRLEWTRSASSLGDNDTLVVGKAGGAAPSFTPEDNTTYTAGEVLSDGSVVVYAGSDSAVEHVVAAGSTMNYQAWALDTGNGKYSTTAAAAGPELLNGYRSGEYAETFSYTNGTAMGAAWGGGNGFGANCWAGTAGSFASVDLGTYSGTDKPTFHDVSGYPGRSGNAVKGTPSAADGGTMWAQRSLARTYTSADGAFYVAFLMAYQHQGPSRWAGLSLCDADGVQKAFFGKGHGANYFTLVVDDAAGSKSWGGDFYGITTTPYPDNAYLVLGKYDFAANKLYVKAIQTVDGASLPNSEPSWDASCQPSSAITAIGRIALNAGADNSSAAVDSIGTVWWDEIRYATTWEELVSGVCPTAVESATADAPVAGVHYVGDFVTNEIVISPHGFGQWVKTSIGGVETDASWSHDDAGTSATWTNTVQATAAGVYGATGGGRVEAFASAGAVNADCGSVVAHFTNYTVTALPAPTGATAARDGIRTNSAIVVSWNTPTWADGLARNTLVVRFKDSDVSAVAANQPVPGKVYYVGDAVGAGVVVYKGTGTSFASTGLQPAKTYYYALYSENNGYYSAYAATGAKASATTAEGGHDITVDGIADDWFADAPEVVNSGHVALGEYVWKDKAGEERKNSGEPVDNTSVDIDEFRVYADADWVYFLVKMNNITDAATPHVAIGLDPRQSGESTGMNWLGDQAATFVGSNYWGGATSVRAPLYQLAIHEIDGSGTGEDDGGNPIAWNQVQVEIYTEAGGMWYAPTGTTTSGVPEVVTGWAATNGVGAGKAVEVRIHRSDLGLDGIAAGATVTERISLATFLNSRGWNNLVGGTIGIAEGTPNAVDSLSIAHQLPAPVADNDCALSSWDEDLSDGAIDFWVDVTFDQDGIVDNQRPDRPEMVTEDNKLTSNYPELEWSAPEGGDSDGFITGWMLEVSTDPTFNPAGGTENGSVALRVNLPSWTTKYHYTHASTSISQVWWRVRSRDNSGALSGYDTPRTLRIGGKLDTTGPVAELLYVGPYVDEYLNGHTYDYQKQYYPDQLKSVTDHQIKVAHDAGSEAQTLGFVVRWSDISGVYATNQTHGNTIGGYTPTAGEFAWNILDGAGRVSPNWDLWEAHLNLTNPDYDPTDDEEHTPPTHAQEEVVNDGEEWTFFELDKKEHTGCWGRQWGYDDAFTPAQTLVGDDHANLNGAPCITNFILSEFTITNFDPGVAYYLTVSAEDNCTMGEYGAEGWQEYGTWASYGAPQADLYGGYCEDGPNYARNITTNQLLLISVSDNDTIAPAAATGRSALWGGYSMAITEDSVDSAPDYSQALDNALEPSIGAGGLPEFRLYDSAVVRESLNFHFNVCDPYISGIQVGNSEVTADATFGDQTNTAFVSTSLGTNWANYVASWSDLRDRDNAANGDGIGSQTVLTWRWRNLGPNEVGQFWGADTGAGSSTNLISLNAWDCDRDRSGDQTSATIAFGTLVLLDDDTVAPNPPTNVMIGDIAAGTELTPEHAPWTNSLEGVTLTFTAATDGTPAEGDIAASGIAGYHVVTNSAEVTNRAKWLPMTTTPGEGGTVTAQISSFSGSLKQGFSHNYLFAEDGDRDRTDDSLPSTTVAFPIAFDSTPPTQVAGLVASTDTVDDPTTQFALSWDSTGVGPDDPDNSRYIADGYTGNHSLSPWASYKIYYGTYDTDAAEASGNAGSWVYANCVENGAYRSWDSITKDNTPADPTATSTYAGLGTADTSSVTLYDLDYDQEYCVVIVGVDQAGNEGPAGDTSWAMNNTIKFYLTKGTVVDRDAVTAAFGTHHNLEDDDDSAAAIYWYAVTNANGTVRRTYDLIYRDATGFNESSNNTWQAVGTVQSNWFVDAGAISRGNTQTLRFYRASYEGRGQRINPTTGAIQRPLMSEEVYAMSSVPLIEGANYVSLHGFGSDATLSAIFGNSTNVWPTGSTQGKCTRIDVYAGDSYGGTGINPTISYYLNNKGKWYTSGNVPADNIVDTNLFLRGFSIVIPPGLQGDHPEMVKFTKGFNTGTNAYTVGGLYWHPILRVPTNNVVGRQVTTAGGTTTTNDVYVGTAEGFSIPIKAGNPRTGSKWNLCAVPLPALLHPSQMNLVESGFKPSDSYVSSTTDIIYAYDTETRGIRKGSGMYCNTNGKWYSITDGKEITGFPFRVNDMLVIVSRNSTQDWTWTFSPSDYYVLPTRWGGW